MARLRVGILFGGRSAEHEISLLSARTVLSALDRTRFEPVPIGIDRSGRWLLQPEALLLDGPTDPRLVRLSDRAPELSIEPRPTPGPVDVVFPVLHGPCGEDGTVQGLLELAELPYVGAGVLGSAVGMDKDVMKRLLREAGLPVAPFRTVRRHELERDPAATCARAAEVGFPLFTKPANLGSSVGIRRVERPSQLPDALAEALSHDGKALAEAAIAGRELECGVLGDEEPVASVPGELVVTHPEGFYSYAAKYLDGGGARLEIPAPISPELTAAVQALSLRVFRLLEASGLARVDLFLRPDGTLVVNEINTMPGFTALSMYPRLWEASGIPPRELITRLVELALARHRRRHPESRPGVSAGRS